MKRVPESDLGQKQKGLLRISDFSARVPALFCLRKKLGSVLPALRVHRHKHQIPFCICPQSLLLLLHRNTLHTLSLARYSASTQTPSVHHEKYPCRCVDWSLYCRAMENLRRLYVASQHGNVPPSLGHFIHQAQIRPLVIGSLPQRDLPSRLHHERVRTQGS